ncbi:hypothetical protein McanMca71_005065 [Microsporum canis]|uniref:Uncharacterized protein n=1 Tax=Arthroderma otae (strain ATCC MYA-4605 / CBS 113480) TaxID=554155 RepID=C5FWJ3_ARTOC|nr:uncharacterized protein MCYG_07096 [Microsporum canis CBS 113480]EEQ34277.1 predicted protein [Microsporum canis CBS 113480]
MGFRERVKRVIFSSRPVSLSPAASSSRLAERLEQAREHTAVSPVPQQHLQHHQHHQKQATTKRARSFTRSIRTGIIKSLLSRPSKRKSNKSEEPWPKIELYKAHEIPRPKYRGPVDKKHLAVLAAYSIVKATEDHRRRSTDSSVSPLAMPSRRGSISSGESAGTATVIVRRPGDVEDEDEDEGSNTTSILSSDGVNISSSTLLTSLTEDEQQQQQLHQYQQRPSVMRLKRTTAFTAADLHHALNAIET